MALGRDKRLAFCTHRAQRQGGKCCAKQVTRRFHDQLEQARLVPLAHERRANTTQRSQALDCDVLCARFPGMHLSPPLTWGTRPLAGSPDGITPHLPTPSKPDGADDDWRRSMRIRVSCLLVGGRGRCFRSRCCRRFHVFCSYSIIEQQQCTKVRAEQSASRALLSNDGSTRRTRTSREEGGRDREVCGPPAAKKRQYFSPSQGAHQERCRGQEREPCLKRKRRF